jgi:hypothetical protein
MEPLANNPASKLLVINLNAIRSIIHKHSTSIPWSNVGGLPPSIVGVWWQSVETEGILVDVELEVGAVEEGGWAGSGDEDGVGEAGACVVGFDLVLLDEVMGRGRGVTYFASRCIF